MKQNTRRFVTALAITGGLALAGSAKADVTLDVFNNTGLTTAYPSWSTTATITPTAGGLNITGTTYGSGNVTIGTPGWIPANPVNATADGDNYVWVSFEFSVPSGNGISISPIIQLDDTVGGSSSYNTYPSDGLTLNENTPYTWFVPLTSLSGNVNLTEINGFNLGLDPEGQAFNITWMGVGLSAVPEPGTLALMGVGLSGALMALRRRMAKA